MDDYGFSPDPNKIDIDHIKTDSRHLFRVTDVVNSQLKYQHGG